MTVQEIIDGIIKKTGMSPLPSESTCDHLMAGRPDQQVTKIVTTFMATVEVIRKAIELKADFIITHEPTWYTGHDTTQWLEEDPVYLAKKRMIEENGIAIWRFHDHMHMGKEDGIYAGYDKELGWDKYVIPNPAELESFGKCYQIPKTALRDLCAYYKEKLDMEVIQIVGDPDMSVERLTVLVGGGSLGLGVEENPMIMMQKNDLDLAVCGDITEWTLSAYINDAAALGLNKGMLVLGHERTEEWGMKHLGAWLKDITGDIAVHFVDAKEPFQYL